MGADFSGYATKAGIKCTDGRTITPEAFKHMDGVTVPLMWQHGHNESTNVLGHADLEARPDGVYCYGYFNGTPSGVNAKALVEHKDVKALSIYANQLVEKTKSVLHGTIREVSLVLSGANSGAFIDNVSIQHADGDVENLEDEAIISMMLELEHEDKPAEEPVEAPEKEEDLEHAAADATVQEVYDTLTDEQKIVVAHIVGVALETASTAQHSDTEGDEKDKNNDEGDLNHKEGSDMTRNVFENNGADGADKTGATLTHDQMGTILAEGKKNGSFKDAVLAHATDYGITNIEMLFPDAQAINNKPEWITRRIEWVEAVLNATRKLPFSKIKSLSADLTHEEARAKGYIKATMKKEQFFSIAKRETGPKTIYKKQKLDRDDIIDMTEFDVVAWLWVEMRFMLREEIARAILVGDGREVDDEDKINEENIRPIALDDEFYTDVVVVPANVVAADLVEAVLLARDNYKGNGQPTAFMTNANMTSLLLTRDTTGRRLYRNVAELASELSVSNIVEIPVMAGVKRDGRDVFMLLVNLSDYSIGSTRGGEITTFDDFDIDFNQYKYLIEGRMSGALTGHKTAQVILKGTALAKATPVSPTFNATTGVVTVPNTANVVYKDKATGTVLASGAQTALASGASVEVVGTPATGYYVDHNVDNDWKFTRA